MPRLLPALCLLFAFVLFLPMADGQEWTRFRGPNGSGVAAADNLPSDWSEEDVNWKVEIPGLGHGSPSIWGEKVFLMTGDPKTAERMVLCLDAGSGKTLWSKAYTAEPSHLHNKSSYGSCTPALDAERLYVGWASSDHNMLVALTHDGDEVWKKDLGRWVSQHGYGTSPMLHNGVLYLANQQQGTKLAAGEKPGVSSILAIDPATGETLWETPQKSVVAAYGVPCIITGKDEKEELVCTSTGNGIFSLDPKTGKENWSAADVFSMRTVSSPVTASGLIFGTTGSGGGGNYVVAVDPNGGEPKEVYRVKAQAPYVPTPIAYKDMLFLWNDKGVLTCIDAATGDVHYRERVGGAFSGSPVLVGSRMFCIAEDGIVHVVEADKTFKPLAKNDLGEDSYSTPAVSAGKMYLRTFGHLISVGK